MEEETEERTDDQQAEEASDAPGGASEGEGGENPDQEAIDKVKALEDDPPENIEDWPDDEAKYKTFGGPEGESSWEEGPTSQLGESNVRHHDDGSVSVEGEKVDNPDDYKGDPIPGGPTDPNSSSVAGEKDMTKSESESESESESDSDSDDSDSQD
jgi:hypothetical protein